jgi:hypothetical protein
MKRIMLTMAVLAVSWSGAGAQSLESLKAGTFEASWQVVRHAPPPPAPVAVPAPVYRRVPPGAAQTRAYFKGGYTWESDALAARNQAENGLRAAGLQVLSGRVYKEANFPFNYGFQIDYLAQAFTPSVQTYTGGAFTWESDAKAELARSVANFKASGMLVVLGQVKKQANYPFNYFYEIDYMQGMRREPFPPHRRPGRW